MNYRDIPQVARARLDKLAQDVEVLTERVARTKDAIAKARSRLTGSFETDEEYHDVNSTLQKLVADLPVIERKRAGVEWLLEEVRGWLDELPADVTLEPVAPANTEGFQLADVQEQIAKYTDELKALQAVPTLSSGVAIAAEAYVKRLARPKVSGISNGEELKVIWPDDIASMFALLFPAEMSRVIVEEARRLSNTPMPLDARRKRIAQLTHEIDKYWRRAAALGADPNTLPPEVVLGVRVVKREAAKKVERRVAAKPRGQRPHSSQSYTRTSPSGV